MRLQHNDPKLQRVEDDPEKSIGSGEGIDRKFRFLLGYIRAALDERDLYKMKSLHYEKLRGKRSHQRSMRLNDQWRLILELRRERHGKLVVVISVEDYH